MAAVTDLTVRDAFAQAALTGLLSSADNLTDLSKVGQKAGTNMAKAAAGLAYEFADAMIEARKPDPLGRDADGVTARFREYLDAKRKTR